MKMLRNAIFVPLGPKVGSLLEAVAKKIGFNPARVLVGLPHPSGANAERVSAFLGRKDLATVSRQVSADAILRSRQILEAKMARLRNCGEFGRL